MNKIVRILPGIFLSLLSLSSCDGLFTEDCIYKGYLHARNGFHHPSDMGTPEQAEMNLMVFPLTGNGVAEYDNLSIPFNGSGDAYGTLHIGSYEFLACNKDVNILEDAGSAATVRLRVPTEQGKITAEQGYAYSSSVTGTVMTDDTLHVTCESKLMVQRIVFNITVTNTGILEYTGITAELDGVTTSRYVRTREKGSGFATLAFHQAALERMNPERDVWTLPGWNFSTRQGEIRTLLGQYRALGEAGLWNNLRYFLQAVVPEAERLGIRLAIHPDDPPLPVFGLPRVVSTLEDLLRLTGAVDLPSNGVTLCTGSLGSSRANDVVKIADRLCAEGKNSLCPRAECPLGGGGGLLVRADI